MIGAADPVGLELIATHLRAGAPQCRKKRCEEAFEDLIL
jgi:hypothetical protein